jgi:O-antigen/teichoic acid export membrane protein
MTVGLSLHAGLASLSLVLLPLASEAHARDDRERLRDIYSRALKLSAALVTFAVSTLVVSGGLFLHVWLGAVFAERSSVALSLHAAAFGILALVSVPWHLAEAIGRPRWNAQLAFLWLVIDGILLIWLTPRYGINGAAAARLVSMLVVPLYGARIERRVFGGVLWSFWVRLLALLALSAAISGAAQHFVAASTPPGWGRLFLAVTLGGVCFVGMLRACRYFSPAERAWLRSRAMALLARSPRHRQS